MKRQSPVRKLSPSEPALAARMPGFRGQAAVEKAGLQDDGERP